MGSSEPYLLVAGTLTLWHMEAKLRKAACILLKCEWSTAQGALRWKSSTSSQPLQPTISIPTASDGSLMRDRYHIRSLTFTCPISLPQPGQPAAARPGFTFTLSLSAYLLVFSSSRLFTFAMSFERATSDLSSCIL